MDATSICNLALAQLGQSQIMSLEDASQSARFCKRFYDQTRDEVLRSHPWNFAGKRLTLSRLSDNPLFGWAFQYQLPEDFLRLLQLNAYSATEALKLYEIEGNRLLTNEGVAQVRYVSRVTDPNLFDALFVEALATKIASKLAQPLTGSRQEAVALLQAYERVVAPLARSVDAREGRSRRRLPFIESMLVQSRGGAGYADGGGGSSFSSTTTTNTVTPPTSPAPTTPAVPVAEPEVGGDYLFNVMEYGALAKGGDDYPGILKALNALRAKGRGTLYFPGGFTYRVQREAVHGIHLDQMSNVTVEFGEGAELVMDNMAAGYAVSHGIYVQGPAENITLRGVRVRYAEMSVVRQTWAPIYFLGANIGVGSLGSGGWYRGASGGAEYPQGIAAGAVKNVRIIDCATENSPSVMLGLVGVDGVQVTNFTGRKSWADGLYHLNFRRSVINGVHLTEVGDDAVSFAAYESDLANANIENAFHGEGSVVSNVTIDGRYPAVGYPPAGSIAFLGARDITVSNVTVRGKYRGIRFELGTEATGALAGLNLNMLANRNIIVSDVVLEGCDQAISVVTKEVDFASDDKWWRNDVTISNVVISGGNLPFDVYADPIASGKTPPRMMCGFTLRGITARGYAATTASLSGFRDCVFADMDFEGAFTFAGYTPYQGNPELTIYPANDSVFHNIRARDLTFLGLKRVWLDEIHSEDAGAIAILFTTCADLNFGTIRVVNTNRDGAAFPGGVIVDDNCRRLRGHRIEASQDAVDLPNLVSLDSAAGHFIDQISIKTGLNKYYRMVFDRSMANARTSQVRRIEWYHGGLGSPSWNVMESGLGVVNELGDANADLYPENWPNATLIKYALTADRTYTLHEDAAAVGRVITLTRTAASTGGAVIIKGLAEQVGAVMETPARGSFIVSGGSASPGVNRFSNITVNGVSVLAAPVDWVGSNNATATALAAAINSSQINYVANAYDSLVVLQAAAGAGATPNGYVIVVTPGGDAAVSNIVPFARGVTAAGAGAVPTAYDLFTFPAATTGAVSFIYTTSGWALLEQAIHRAGVLSYGDVSPTLTAVSFGRTHVFNVALTANRTVTINTAGVRDGERLRVVRSGLGAFTLNVGGVRTLPASTAAWVDLEYNGTALIVTAYGTL